MRMMESDVSVHKDIIIEYVDDNDFKVNGLDSYYGQLKYHTKGKEYAPIKTNYITIEKNEIIYAFVWFAMKEDIPLVDSEIPMILSSIIIN